LKLQVVDVSVLLTGDGTNETEASMLATELNLDSNVLKVGHHGSSSSTSQAFLSAVTPTYAVICVGADNSYGHPTQQTLDRLVANSITVFRPTTNGTIIMDLTAAAPNPTVVVPEFPTLTIVVVMMLASTIVGVKVNKILHQKQCK